MLINAVMVSLNPHQVLAKCIKLLDKLSIKLGNVPLVKKRLWASSFSFPSSIYLWAFLLGFQPALLPVFFCLFGALHLVVGNSCYNL